MTEQTTAPTDKLWISDADLIRWLGLPEKKGRQVLRKLDQDRRTGFPQKNAFWDNRRYVPAVKQWIARHGGLNVPAVLPEPEVPEPKHRPQLVDIYFLASETHVKIGFTAVGVKRRIHAIRQPHYEELKLLGVISDVPRYVETRLHKKFEAFRVKGKREWFRRVSEIEEFIRTAHLRHWRTELLS
jgi:hypothetical protein